MSDIAVDYVASKNCSPKPVCYRQIFRAGALLVLDLLPLFELSHD
jgi:hypothetical protein